MLLAWLCLVLAVVLCWTWLHTPVRTPGLTSNVRAACCGLLACAAAWLLMHFVCAGTEARWTDTLLHARRPARNATDPLQTVVGRALRDLRGLRDALRWAAAMPMEPANATGPAHATGPANATARDAARNTTHRWL